VKHHSQALSELLGLRQRDNEPDTEIITGPSVYSGKFKLQHTITDVLTAVATLVNDIWHLKTGRQQRSTINARQAAAALDSYHYLQHRDASGHYVPLPTSPAALTAYQITQPFRTRDGRWFLPHFGLLHLKQRMQSLLDCSDTTGSVAAAVGHHDADELEHSIAANGVCGGIVRTADEWLAHPQGRALASQSVVEITKIGESDPEPFSPHGPPLHGIRMLDLTRILAGPVATRTCAEHGADVLMVAARHTPQIKNFVIDLSHGKRSCFLDLNNHNEHSVMRSLVSQCDVFSQGYRPGALAKRGFSPEDIATMRPGIIYLTTSCYGQHGPWSDRAGWEQIAQAVSGICHHNNPHHPALLPVNACDFLTGYLGAFGIMLALLQRARDGGSYHVNVSLCQSAMFLMKHATLSEAIAPVDLTDAEITGFQMQSDTAYGKLRHLAPAINFQQSKAQWQHPTPALGSDQPQWR